MTVVHDNIGFLAAALFLSTLGPLAGRKFAQLKVNSVFPAHWFDSAVVVWEIPTVKLKSCFTPCQIICGTHPRFPKSRLDWVVSM